MPGYSENDPQVVPVQQDLLPPGYTIRTGYVIRNCITPLRHHSLINCWRVTIQGATGCRANKQSALNERRKEAPTEGQWAAARGSGFELRYSSHTGLGCRDVRRSIWAYS